MRPLVALAALGGLGAWLLFWGKKPAASTTSVIVPAKPGPVVVKTPLGSATVTPPTATKPGSVTVTEPPVATTEPGIMPPALVAALESDNPDDLYRKGMTSNDKAYVAAAAARLAALSDTRAMDLTLRVANWGN